MGGRGKGWQGCQETLDLALVLLLVSSWSWVCITSLCGPGFPPLKNTDIKIFRDSEIK